VTSDATTAPDFHALPSIVGDDIRSIEALTHNEGNAATGGIWRVTGSRGSAVVKIATPPDINADGSGAWQTSDEPAHWNYWQREVLAYRTGFAGEIYAEAGITAPALLDAAERADGSIELWLEDKPGAPATAWSVARLGVFARQLGMAQGSLAGNLPAKPWLSKRWLRQYLENGPSKRVHIDESHWDHPVARPWPRPVRAALRRLWVMREQMLTVAEAAPRTLCHLDVWPTNLIDDDGTTVLLDWSFVGEGGIGEDVSNLIVDSVTDGLIDAQLLPEIDATVTDAYISGLAEAGWRGSADEVRRAIAASGAAKYSWFAPALVSRVLRNETVGSQYYGQDRSHAEALERLSGLVSLLASWSEMSLD
jgi:hypothetical protein